MTWCKPCKERVFWKLSNLWMFWLQNVGTTHLHFIYHHWYNGWWMAGQDIDIPQCPTLTIILSVWSLGPLECCCTSAWHRYFLVRLRLMIHNLSTQPPQLAHILLFHSQVVLTEDSKTSTKCKSVRLKHAIADQFSWEALSKSCQDALLTHNQFEGTQQRKIAVWSKGSRNWHKNNHNSRKSIKNCFLRQPCFGKVRNGDHLCD